MSPRDQRIAIEAALGFTDEIEPGIGNGWYRRNPTTGQTRRIPEYLTDLNSMRDALLGLTKEQKERFGIIIMDVVGWVDGTGYHDFYLVATATAAQYAEAYLKTLGLWINS